MLQNHTGGRVASERIGLARGSSLNLVGAGATSLLSLGLILVLTRTLGQGRAGAFIAATALFQVAVIVASLGVDTGLVRSLSARESRPERLSHLMVVALGPVVAASLGLTLVGMLTATRLGEALGDSRYDGLIAEYIAALAPFLAPAALLQVLLGATRGFGPMKPTVALDRIARPGLQLLLVALALVVGTTGRVMAAGWAVPYLVCAAVAGWWLFRLARSTTTSGTTSGSVGVTARAFWAFTLPRTFAATFRTAMQWFDVVLVAALASPEAAAAYAVATRILQLGILAAFSIGQAAEPRLGEAVASGERGRTLDLYRVGTAWIVMLTWPFYLVVGIFAPAVLSVFGSGFTEAAPVVMILVAGALISSAVGPVDVLLLMAGKSSWSLYNTFLSLIVGIGLNLWLIPRMGITGAAIAWSAGRVVANLVPAIQVYRSFDLNPLGTAWATATALSVAIFGGCGLAVRMVFGSSVMVALLFSLAATGVYLLALRRFRDRLHMPSLAAMLKRHQPAMN